MTARSKLPADAFDFYVGLGPSRSYIAVAREFGVSKRSVARKAAAENWQQRRADLEALARADADVKLADELAAQQLRHVTRQGELRDAVSEVMTPARIKAVVVALFKCSVQKEDIGAARLLLERILGRPRAEPLPLVALDLPDGLETVAQIRVAANALIQGVTDGSLAPEDAQKMTTIIESARKSIETEELERRIHEIEEKMEREKKQ